MLHVSKGKGFHTQNLAPHALREKTLGALRRPIGAINDFKSCILLLLLLFTRLKAFMAAMEYHREVFKQIYSTVSYL